MNRREFIATTGAAIAAPSIGLTASENKSKQYFLMFRKNIYDKYVADTTDFKSKYVTSDNAGVWLFVDKKENIFAHPNLFRQLEVSVGRKTIGAAEFIKDLETDEILKNRWT